MMSAPHAIAAPVYAGERFRISLWNYALCAWVTLRWSPTPPTDAEIRALGQRPGWLDARWDVVTNPETGA